MEEGKGEAYASKIDVRCSDRNRIIAHKNVLIATGGSATAEMAMRYSTFGHWISRIWLAFMDESQQYGNYHEIAALAAIQQPTLSVFIGDHRQTPGGLSKGRAAAANRLFSLVWPIRTRLGPYNCVSREKQKCTRTRVVQKLRQIIMKNKENQNSTTTATKNDPQIPQPDLRFATSKTAKQQKTGQGPTKTQNTFRFALDTVTLATVSSSKTPPSSKLITNAAVHGI